MGSPASLMVLRRVLDEGVMRSEKSSIAPSRLREILRAKVDGPFCASMRTRRERRRTQPTPILPRVRRAER